MWSPDRKEKGTFCAKDSLLGIGFKAIPPLKILCSEDREPHPFIAHSNSDKSDFHDPPFIICPRSVAMAA
jgi:hypothetical protein